MPPSSSAPDAPPPAAPTGRVQAIDRAFVLLRALADAPRGLTALELSRRAGIERTTVHRLLKTLAHWDMVAAEDGLYVLGPESLLLATAHASRLNVRRAALPYAVEIQQHVLQGLAALVSISVPARDRLVIVERLWTPLTPMNVIIDIGNHFGLEQTASGRAILSTYGDPQARETLGPDRFDAVRADLDAIRAADGFSASIGRFKRGLASLAYPFRGRGPTALGAIVVSGLELENDLHPDSALAQHVQRACDNVSRALRDA